MQSSMKKLNYQYILINLIATILLIGAFENLAYLYNFDSLETFNETGISGIEELAKSKEMSTGELISYKLYSLRLIPVLGLSLAFGIGISYVIRKKTDWINVLIVFFIGFILIGFEAAGILINLIFFVSIQNSLIFTFLLLISGGIFISFSKRITNLWMKIG